MRRHRAITNRRGAGIVEYGILIGLIAVGAIVAVQQAGGSVKGLLNTVAVELGAVGNTVETAGTTSDAGTGSEAGTGPSTPTLDPSSCPSVGDTCNDETIYAGDNTNNGNPIYVAAISEQPWQGGNYNWDDAVAFCEDAETLGYDDWSLPGLDFYPTLVNNDGTGDFALESGSHWSGYNVGATQQAPSNYRRRYNQPNGYPPDQSKNNTYRVRCVR